MAASSTLPHATTAPPQFYLDDNWKLSKKESSSRSSRSSTSAAASSATTTTPLMKNSSQRKCSFSRKCARLVKEQRARFYIMRRCVTMLICWRDYNDS
ncbi:Small polypeptide DEVIL 11 [Linum perenne]